MGLFDIFSSKPAQDAARARIAGLNAGYDRATSALDTGLTNATNYYNQALVPFATLSGTANNAYSAYADALGLNGAEGNARALTRFQSAPGYQYQVDQAIENADRGAAARGTLNSGGQRANEIGIAQNLANQNWSNYLASFAPYISQAPTLATGQSNVYSALGGLNYGAGKDLAGYGWQKETGTGDANASAELARYNASGNIWNALFAGDVHRAVLDRAKYRADWAAALERAEAARVLRDAAIRRDVAADADRRIADIQRESAQLQTRVADYEKVLSTSNAAACRLSADDARRLRQLFTAATAAR